MQENGMSAAQAIRCATLTAAEELGVKDRGVLEEGKIADIVVLDADPLLDLDALTEHLTAVYKEGILV